MLEIEVLSIKRGATELKMYYFAQIEKARMGEGEIEGGGNVKGNLAPGFMRWRERKRKGSSCCYYLLVGSSCCYYLPLKQVQL